MKRGCLTSLVIWAVCSGAYWHFIHTRFQPPLDWLVPVVAGMFTGIVIANLRTGIGLAVQAMRVSQQSQFSGGMGEKPRDGQVVTVPGRIRATGASLRGPISGKPAVLYSYEISHMSTRPSETPDVKDYSGFALTPSVIDSSFGPIRLLGFPMLEGFGKAKFESTIERANAASYVASAPFIEMSGFNPAAIYREVKDLMTDDDGQVRKDWRMTTNPELGDDSDLFEQIVAPGEQVCAFGRYSAEKGGLIPDIGGGNVLRLLRGEAQAVAGSLWRKAAGSIVSAVIFAAAIGILFTVLKAREGQPPIGIPVSQRQLRENIEALHTAARNGDLAIMERLVDKGTPVDGRDLEKSTPLARAVDEKTAAWLIARGADVNAANEKGMTVLMEHSRMGNAEVVKLLVKSGVNLDVIEPTWKSTALQQALDAERLDVAQILRDAGAHDDMVTEKNGHSVDEKSVPVRRCLAWLEAMQREDLAALNEISTRGPFKDVDFKVWKEARPAKARLVRAFANDDAATVSLRGARTPGHYSTWTYQLVHRDGVWKISNERWETRLDGVEQ